MSTNGQKTRYRAWIYLIEATERYNKDYVIKSTWWDTREDAECWKRKIELMGDADYPGWSPGHSGIAVIN